MKNPFKVDGQVDLVNQPIVPSMVAFIMPLFWGLLLQQFYTLADAWVVGNYASNEAFAAVSSAGNLAFLIIGFFNGIALGAGVIISHYYGSGDMVNTSRSIHTDFLFGIVSSILATVIGVGLVPYILRWMNTPESVMSDALWYFRIYFGGVSTIVMYNVCMAIMRSLGDSLHPLYYLIVSSVANVALDFLFVAIIPWGAAGAAFATVLAQGLSCVLCIRRMIKTEGIGRLDLSKLAFYPGKLREILSQGIPSGIQNSVISIGNVFVQAGINSFGAFAMSGHGAYSKIESVVFLPINCISMSIPTFISQNLGAKQYGRAKKGALLFVGIGMLLSELIGAIVFLFSSDAIRLFIDQEEAIAFGISQIRVDVPFYMLLSFSHCAAGVMRGCGKSTVPMVTMLTCWCLVRILIITFALPIFPQYTTIAWAYPITWSLSSIVFIIYLCFTDWTHGFEQGKNLA